MFTFKADEVLWSCLLIYVRAELLLAASSVPDIAPKGSNPGVIEDFALLYFIGGLCFWRFNKEDIAYKVSVFNCFWPEVLREWAVIYKSKGSVIYRAIKSFWGFILLLTFWGWV
jgi:hypothetical protein